MRKSLYCAACGARLTTPLEILSGKDPAVPELVVRYQQPLTARGIAFKSWKPQRWIYTERGAPLHFAPQYWLNPADLTEAVRKTSNRKRLGGCCGEAGTDGPNRMCPCKAEVGTLQNDCMVPLVFIPEPSATEWRDED